MQNAHFWAIGVALPIAPDFAVGAGKDRLWRGACMAAIWGLAGRWSLVAAVRDVLRVVHRVVGSQGVCGPPGDAMLAEGAHPFVGDAVPQRDACCSLGEAGAG